jgi:hypothetical protein
MRTCRGEVKSRRLRATAAGLEGPSRVLMRERRSPAQNRLAARTHICRFTTERHFGTDATPKRRSMTSAAARDVAGSGNARPRQVKELAPVYRWRTSVIDPHELVRRPKRLTNDVGVKATTHSTPGHPARQRAALPDGGRARAPATTWPNLSANTEVVQALRRRSALAAGRRPRRRDRDGVRPAARQRALRPARRHVLRRPWASQARGLRRSMPQATVGACVLLNVVTQPDRPAAQLDQRLGKGQAAQLRPAALPKCGRADAEQLCRFGDAHELQVAAQTLGRLRGAREVAR